MNGTKSKNGGSASSSPALGLDAFVRELNPCDVLLGRGTGPNEHTGNKYFREIVQKQKDAYFSKTNRKDKAEIIRSTIDQVKAKNGRFLKRLEKYETRRLGLTGDAIYAYVDHESAIEKTKQAFRYAMKKESSINDDEGDNGETSRPAQKKARVESTTAAVSANTSQPTPPAHSTHPGYIQRLQPVDPVPGNTPRESASLLGSRHGLDRAATAFELLGPNFRIPSHIWPQAIDPAAAAAAATPLTLEGLLARRRLIDAVASATTSEAMLRRALAAGNTLLPQHLSSIPASQHPAFINALAQLAAKDAYMGRSNFPRDPPPY